MSKVLIIQQWFGLGDCIWGQTIANDYINDGYKVLWPVKEEWVEGLQRAYPKVTFVDHELIPINYENKRLYEENGFTYLPMRFSESLMRKPYKFHMESKYSFLGKDWKRWKEYAMPVRDISREKELMSIFDIDIKSKYNFIATRFGSDGHRKIDIKIGNDYKNIELEYIPGFSLFDWCSIIQFASEIHAVSSSTLYLFEVLTLTAKSVHLYPRVPLESDFKYVEFLFSKNYILHT